MEYHFVRIIKIHGKIGENENQNCYVAECSVEIIGWEINVRD